MSVNGFRTGLAAVAVALAMSPALSQDLTLPDYAYDMMAEISIATTADGKCDGISQRPKKVQARMLEMLSRLVKDGYDATAAATHFRTPEALAQIARREAALRARHGVAAEGDAALCEAIRAEAGENKDIARMVRLR